MGKILAIDPYFRTLELFCFFQPRIGSLEGERDEIERANSGRGQ